MGCFRVRPVSAVGSFVFFFSSRRRHTRSLCDWSSDVCSSDLCQTFCLVATWLGLAPFCTAALVDPEIEADLGVDGSSEFVLYAAGVGVRDTTTTSAD